MPRNLDSTLAAHLGDPLIGPVIFAEIDFKSGKQYVWSGVGNFVGPNGNTYVGVGNFASIGAIGENTEVKAEGTTITLSGIGDSLIDIPDLSPSPPSPPVTVPSGQSVAWSYATEWTFPAGMLLIPPSIFNGEEGVTGSDSATATSGDFAIVGGDVFADTSMGAVLSGYAMPPEIPEGAEITAVYVVVNDIVLTGQNATVTQNGNVLASTPASGNVAVDVHSLGAVGDIAVSGQCSLPLGGSTGAFGFAGVAVYYVGTPKTKMGMLQEALGDIWIGAPAKIWYGLMDLDTGALYGVPYLIFSGTVDKPSIHVGLDTLSITLALENRLVNLQRANQRRYTAADQKIYYPTDMAFNWVESLNDIALRWGS